MESSKILLISKNIYLFPKCPTIFSLHRSCTLNTSIYEISTEFLRYSMKNQTLQKLYHEPQFPSGGDFLSSSLPMWNSLKISPMIFLLYRNNLILNIFNKMTNISKKILIYFRKHIKYRLKSTTNQIIFVFDPKIWCQHC